MYRKHSRISHKFVDSI